MTTTALQIEINTLPINLRQEVADFVEFLKTKKMVQPNLKFREFGYAKGKIKLARDFDEPLKMFEDYM